MPTLPNFSHFYVEREALEYPDTIRIKEQFSRAEFTVIDNYKQIFNRPRQSWDLQKRSLKPILAVRRDNFIYEGSPLAPNFGHHHFAYNALVLNCLYDCEYCYLQGMYPSAYPVLFVNHQDYFTATSDFLKTHGSLYLCISYDTDLLTFEKLVPYCSKWIDFARENPNLTIELRTKSGLYSAIASSTPPDNVVLAWTLSPESIAKTVEHRTPGASKRIKSLSEAVNDGWKVRLCFDPVTLSSDWYRQYSELLDATFREIKPENIFDVSFGFFRMPKQYFKQMKKQRPALSVLYDEYDSENDLVKVTREKEQAARTEFNSLLLQYVQPEKIDYCGP